MKRQNWNDYYATDHEPWSEPERELVTLARTMTPGPVLVLACGEGADCLWLAEHGWQVSGVDFAAAAIALAAERAEARGLSMALTVADITTHDAEKSFGLVHMGYAHLPPPARRLALGRAAAALAPGGTLLYNAFADSPQNATLPATDRPSREAVVAELSALGLTVVASHQRRRTVKVRRRGAMEVDVLTVQARRP